MSWHPISQAHTIWKGKKKAQPGLVPVLAPTCLLRTVCAYAFLTLWAQAWVLVNVPEEKVVSIWYGRVRWL